MEIGKTIGIACSSFAITNIDDIFVLVTFFAEATTSRVLTPWKVVIGQYIGFTAIIVLSMIGYGLAFLIPVEPIGFLGLVPMLLGVWLGLGLLIPCQEDDEPEVGTVDSLKSILKIAAVTIMNGGDNVGTYIPIFSQAKGAEIGVYVVVFYILLGVWCTVAYFVINQRHILRIAQKYIHWIMPFLYVGLGIFIVVKSECYLWSIEQIDEDLSTHPGKIIIGVVTSFAMLAVIGILATLRWKKRATETTEQGTEPAVESTESDLTLTESHPVVENKEPDSISRPKSSSGS
jgi:cadmium resistance protein CadD (predicted permease)